MNKHLTQTLKAALAAVAMSLITATTQAQIISVNFTDSSAPYGFGPYYLLSPGDAAGAVPHSSWVNIHSTSATNVASTTLDLSVTGSVSPGFWGFYGASGDNNRMLGAYYEVAGGVGTTLSLSLSDIPYALYDIYVYSGPNADRIGSQYSITDGTTTYQGQWGDPSGGGPGLAQITSTSTPEIGTYVRFQNLTGATKNITLTITGTTGPTPGLSLSGFQVVQVPEPSTYALVALGLGGLWLLRRRMTKA